MTPEGVVLTGDLFYRTSDISLSAPGMNWNLMRSYTSNNDGQVQVQGNRWSNNSTDSYIYNPGGATSFIVDAANRVTFTLNAGTPPTYTAPSDSYLLLRACFQITFPPFRGGEASSGSC